MLVELAQVAEDATQTFGSLSAEQINWKPAADSWSIGQCFDHLVKSNQAFDPQFKELLSGNRQHSFWENYSPLTGFFGNFLLKALRNDAKKTKAPSKDIVPPSDVPADIIEQFVKHQDEFIGKIKSLDGIDLTKTVVTSPFLKLMTYRLDTALEIACEHEKRHFRQAQRVLESDGFPH
jgi:hypothetical protein